jgi:hypothetical protein
MSVSFALFVQVLPVVMPVQLESMPLKVKMQELSHGSRNKLIKYYSKLGFKKIGNMERLNIAGRIIKIHVITE